MLDAVNAGSFREPRDDKQEGRRRCSWGTSRRSVQGGRTIFSSAACLEMQIGGKEKGRGFQEKTDVMKQTGHSSAMDTKDSLATMEQF